jgi:hypothetical protein
MILIAALTHHINVATDPARLDRAAVAKDVAGLRWMREDPAGRAIISILRPIGRRINSRSAFGANDPCPRQAIAPVQRA